MTKPDNKDYKVYAEFKRQDHNQVLDGNICLLATFYPNKQINGDCGYMLHKIIFVFLIGLFSFTGLLSPALGQNDNLPTCQEYEFLYIRSKGGYGCALIPQNGEVPKCGDNLPFLNDDGTFGCRQLRKHQVIIESCPPDQKQFMISDTQFGCKK